MVCKPGHRNACIAPISNKDLRPLMGTKASTPQSSPPSSSSSYYSFEEDDEELSVQEPEAKLTNGLFHSRTAVGQEARRDDLSATEDQSEKESSAATAVTAVGSPSAVGTPPSPLHSTPSTPTQLSPSIPAPPPVIHDVMWRNPYEASYGVMGEKQSKTKTPSGDVETSFTMKLSDRNYGRQYVSHGFYGESDPRLAEVYSVAESLVDLLSTSVGARADSPSAPAQLPPSQLPPQTGHTAKLADKNASLRRSKKSGLSEQKSDNIRATNPALVTTDAPPPSTSPPRTDSLSSSKAPSLSSVSSTRTNEHSQQVECIHLFVAPPWTRMLTWGLWG